LGYNWVVSRNVLNIILIDPIMRINRRTVAGVTNWCSRYICLTQHFKLYPEDPKIFMEHGIAPIYVGIHLVCISGKICKCGEGRSGF